MPAELTPFSAQEAGVPASWNPDSNDSSESGSPRLAPRSLDTSSTHLQLPRLPTT